MWEESVLGIGNSKLSCFELEKGKMVEEKI